MRFENKKFKFEILKPRKAVILSSVWEKQITSAWNLGRVGGTVGGKAKFATLSEFAKLGSSQVGRQVAGKLEIL
jgi:hypothetical protein